MSNSGPFGFDPEDFDRVAREAGEGLRDAVERINRFITSARTDTSSADVGSSSTSIRGCAANARAMATRCACPPESSCG